MKRLMTILATLAVSASAFGVDHEEVTGRVYLDARAIERIAGVTHRDLPRAVLQRVVAEDLDLLRGKGKDSTFEFVHFERFASGRVVHGTTIDDGGDDKRLDRKQLRAKHVYQFGIRVPKRKMLVVRNQAVYVEKVDLDYRDENGIQKFDEIVIAETIKPGEEKTWELPEIASDLVATVHARAFRKSASLELILVQARLVDNSDSPYFGAVQSAKLLDEAIRQGNIAATETHAGTLATRIKEIHGTGSAAMSPLQTPEKTPVIPASDLEIENPPRIEIFLELQRIEDLITGSEPERREGLDRLHQLVRRLRIDADR